MERQNENTVTVETTINAPVDKVWSYFTQPDHITEWYFASDDWQAPYAENDLRPDGKFKIRMDARDGSSGFDFEGVYTNISKNDRIEYVIPDGRKVSITFSDLGAKTRVVETFETENENPVELQRGGWQAILDNLKKHTESN